MKDWVRRLWPSWHGADEIVVVSGLPRSGTSMMMRMLQAGGFPVANDGVRAADSQNPNGYFELERMKDLGRDSDKAWLREYRGQAVKVISHLLHELPLDNRYRVILMVRNLDEVIASQNALLAARGEPNASDDTKIREVFETHLIQLATLVQRRRMPVLEVFYADALRDPRGTARSVADFVGRALDLERMAAAVDPALYRNRIAEPAGAPPEPA